MVLIADSSAGADVVFAQPSIKERNDIIGKVVAYEHHALGELMLHHFLKKYDLTKDQVKTVDLTLSEQPQHFIDKHIDIAITYYPEAWKIAKLESNELFNSREIPNTILDVLTIRTEVLARNPAYACKAVERHLQGVKVLKQNPLNSKYLLASIMGLSDKEVVENLASLGIPSAVVNDQMLRKEKAVHTIAAELQTILIKHNNIKQSISIDQLFSAECLNRVME